MASSYPGALDNLNDASRPTLTHREVTEAIEAIQATLGVNAGVPRTYTPVWTAASTAPSLGNGVLSGRYITIGKLCRVQFYFQAGSTTTFGSGTFRFSLPVPAKEQLIGVEAGGRIEDAGNFAHGVKSVYFRTFDTFEIIQQDAPFVSSTAPFTWTNGDYITMSFSYEVE